VGRIHLQTRAGRVYGDVAQAGDLGWNTGPTVIEDTSPEKKPARHGMFFSVWKRQGDGSWRVALDLGADTPAAVAPLNAPFKTSYRASGRTPDKQPAASVNVEEEIAGLLKVEREFLATAKASSVGQAYQSRLSDDARVHRPSVMPVVGKDALQGWLAQQTMTLSGEPIKADVSRCRGRRRRRSTIWRRRSTPASRTGSSTRPIAISTVCARPSGSRSC